MSPHYQRALMLLQTNRVDDAITEIRTGLAADPDDGYLLALLAQTYIRKEDYPQSAIMAEQALATDPNESYFHSVKAQTLLVTNRSAAALKAIKEALRLAPATPSYYGLLATIHHHRKEWQEALEAAELGLELDAENVDLLNNRSEALVKLNRRVEAVETADFSLKNAPENADSHVNRAYAALNIGDYDTAFKHYREALRLEPNNEYARYGLKEAIKAKNPAYRGVLNYFLWMSRLQDKYQWGFVIGIYLLYRVVLWLAESYPEWSNVLTPFIALYILFAFSTWIANPVANFFLRFHPLGKHALDEDETLASNIVMSLLAGGFGMIAVFYATGGSFDFGDGIIRGDYYQLFILGFVAIFMTIPVGGMFNARKGTPARKNLMTYTIIIALAGIGSLFLPILLTVFAIGIFLYGWAANYLIMKSAREF